MIVDLQSLTHEAVLQIQPGIEIDRMVAVYIMGIDVCTKHYVQTTMHPEWCFTCRKPLPAFYSLDIIAAWSITDKFAGMRMKMYKGKHWCSLWNNAEDWEHKAADGESGWCDTGELAICRASLIARVNVVWAKS